MRTCRDDLLNREQLHSYCIDLYQTESLFQDVSPTIQLGSGLRNIGDLGRRDSVSNPYDELESIRALEKQFRVSDCRTDLID